MPPGGKGLIYSSEGDFTWLDVLYSVCIIRIDNLGIIKSEITMSLKFRHDSIFKILQIWTNHEKPNHFDWFQNVF